MQKKKSQLIKISFDDVFLIKPPIIPSSKTLGLNIQRKKKWKV